MFLYSRDIDKGLWYLSGSGMGPLSARARQMMKKAIEGKHRISDYGKSSTAT
jgi:hypothetical protein